MTTQSQNSEWDEYCEIFSQWIDAKKIEATAKARRIEIEKALLDHGIKTHTHRQFKVTVTQGTDYQIDPDTVREIVEQDPTMLEHANAITKRELKISLKVKEYKNLPGNIKAIFEKAITSKPKTPLFKIEIVQSENQKEMSHG